MEPTTNSEEPAERSGKPAGRDPDSIIARMDGPSESDLAVIAALASRSAVDLMLLTSEELVDFEAVVTICEGLEFEPLDPIAHAELKAGIDAGYQSNETSEVYGDWFTDAVDEHFFNLAMPVEAQFAAIRQLFKDRAAQRRSES